MTQPEAAHALTALRRVFDGVATVDDWETAHDTIDLLAPLADPGIAGRLPDVCPFCNQRTTNKRPAPTEPTATDQDIEIARLYKQVRDLKAQLAQARAA